MATFTMAIGSMTKLMATVHMRTMRMLSMSAPGAKTNNMVTELRHGRTPASMKETSNGAKNTALALSGGPMAPATSVNSATTTSMERVCTLGLMAENMKESGSSTGCTAKERLLGLIFESTLVSTKKIRNMATASSSGQTVDATEESGRMESNMAKVHMSAQTAERGMENGKMEKE